MTTFNYAKWDKIELSDDESDLHPNIDKDSWFRLKHRSRLEREEREDDEVKGIAQRNADDLRRLSVLKGRLARLQSGEADEDERDAYDPEAVKGEIAEVEAEVGKRNTRVEEINERRAWNIDNICKTTEEKTLVSKSTATSLKADDFEPTGLTEQVMSENRASAQEAAAPAAKAKSDVSSSSSAPAATSAAVKPAPSTAFAPAQQPTPASDRKAALSYNDYVIQHEALLEQFSEIEDLEATRDFLFKHCDVLLHEHSQSYMLLSCLEDEMNGKKKRMRLVCRQSQILSHVTELGVSMKLDPRSVVLPFFRRMEEKQHWQSFTTALSEFIEKIQRRAVDKRKEMDAESEQEDRESRLGPGGLDPIETLKKLPPVLREAFESQDVQRLQLTLAAMPPAEAKACMKMCVDAGLWVVNAEGEEEDELA